MGNQPSLVQHYWSLSAEEQFYVLWPLLVVAGLVVVRRGGWSLRRVLLVVLGLVTVASFAYSVWQTADDPSYAYFVTPTRAWEFGVGALLALVGTSSEAAPDAGRRRTRAGATRRRSSSAGSAWRPWCGLVSR